MKCRECFRARIKAGFCVPTMYTHASLKPTAGVYTLGYTRRVYLSESANVYTEPIHAAD